MAEKTEVTENDVDELREFSLAFGRLLCRDIDAAEQLCHDAIQKARKNSHTGLEAHYHSVLSNCFFLRRQPHEAIACLQAAEALRPTDSYTKTSIARAYLDELSDPTSALDKLQEAEALLSGPADLYDWLDHMGSVLIALGKLPEAIELSRRLSSKEIIELVNGFSSHAFVALRFTRGLLDEGHSSPHLLAHLEYQYWIPIQPTIERKPAPSWRHMREPRFYFLRLSTRRETPDTPTGPTLTPVDRSGFSRLRGSLQAQAPGEPSSASL